MAHDTKNPLAAIFGAAQVLQGMTLTEEQREYVDLLLEQSARIRTIAERYERLGRVEPTLAQVDLEALIGRVAAAQKLVAQKVRFHLEVAPRASRCVGDADLLEGALENLVRNAIEAMPNGGDLWMRAIVDEGAILVQVADTGEGMDPRRVQRAFEEFYTTKTGGSGLGLPFVRRVALSHGGDVSIKSRRGEGTTLQMRLPQEQR
jgi:signal transduction histidine kinase